MVTGAVTPDGSHERHLLRAEILKPGFERPHVHLHLQTGTPRSNSLFPASLAITTPPTTASPVYLHHLS
jgi:hypothetical protein